MLSRSTDPGARNETATSPGLRRALSLFSAAGIALVLTSCVPAAIAGGAIGAGIVAAVLVSECYEPVSVQVWDHTSSYPVCDAKVTAEKDGSVSNFSPCYQTYLGTGSWKIVATKPGFPQATATVEVSENRKCSEPSFHSVDLTLGSDAALSPQSIPTRPAPAGPPPPAPATATAPPPATVPAPPPPPSPAPAAPSSTVPSAAFPQSTSPPPEVPAPATK